MTPAPKGPLIVAVAAVLLLGSLSVWLQAERDRLPLPTTTQEELYLSQRATGRVTFTHRALASDLYWIRAVQYFGGNTRIAQQRALNPLEPPPSLAAEPPVSFDLLYPLLDITTTLDPRFNIAYRFGAVFLSEPYPHGPGRPDLAIALLEKGLKISPEKWEYWHDIGFVYYWNVHDYLKASDAFRRGADLPGAPWWLRSMAATMLAKGGDRDTSRVLWRQLYETANNEYARAPARKGRANDSTRPLARRVAHNRRRRGRADRRREKRRYGLLRRHDYARTEGVTSISFARRNTSRAFE